MSTPSKRNADDRVRLRHLGEWKTCPNGHLNSPNAKQCWKCGKKVDELNDRQKSVAEMSK